MKRMIRWMIILLMVIIICFIPVAFYELLPWYLNSNVLPRLTNQYGIKDFSGEIRRIGLNGMNASFVRLGNRDDSLSIDSIQIDYSLPELIHKHIRRIRLSGCQLVCSIQQDGIFVQLPDIKQTKSAKSDSNDGQSFLVERVEFYSSKFVIEWQNRRYPILFDAVVSSEPGQQRYNCISTIDIRGHRIKIAVQIRLQSQTADIHFDTEPIDLERFCDLIHQVPGISISGSIQLSGNIGLQLNPFKILSASIAGNFINNASEIQGIKFQKNPKNPIQIVCRSTDGISWELSVSAIGIDHPVPAQISNFSCQLTLQSNGLTGTGKLNVVLEKFHTPYGRVESTPMNAEITTAYIQDQSWKIKFISKLSDSSKSKQIRWSGNSFDASFKTPIIQLEGDILSGKSEFSFNVSDAMIQAKQPTATVKIPLVNLKSSIRFQKNTPLWISGNFTIDGSKADAQVDTTAMIFPVLTATGNWGINSKGELEFNSLTTIEKGSVKNHTHHLQLDGIQVQIPFFLSKQSKTVQGKFGIDSINWNRQGLGGIDGSIRQKDDTITWEASHKNLLFKDLSLKLSGKVIGFLSNNFSGDIELTGSYPGKRDIELEKLLSSAKGISWNGKLDANAKVTFSGKGFQGDLKISCKDARISDKSKEITIDGVQTDMYFPNILKLVSASNQKITFQKAQIGTIEFQNGDIGFQLEPDGSLFFEKINFKWCKGNVSAQSFRISPGVEDYHIVLYCDRINLAMAFLQFGAGNAKGEGTVNGKIPIKYQNKKLIFEDGFLYSTPGEGGTIQVTGTENYMVGIPKGTPQYNQIDLAREALKDFDYTWAKLGLQTQGDDLKLQLQFDGKPAKPLPFVYRKEIGGFTRVEGDSDGSIFQGIRLDVNVGLPLNQIIRYKDILKQFKK